MSLKCLSTVVLAMHSIVAIYVYFFFFSNVKSLKISKRFKEQF